MRDKGVKEGVNSMVKVSELNSIFTWRKNVRWIPKNSEQYSGLNLNLTKHTSVEI